MSPPSTTLISSSAPTVAVLISLSCTGVLSSKTSSAQSVLDDPTSWAEVSMCTLWSWAEDNACYYLDCLTDHFVVQSKRLISRRLGGTVFNWDWSSMHSEIHVVFDSHTFNDNNPNTTVATSYSIIFTYQHHLISQFAREKSYNFDHQIHQTLFCCNQSVC